MSEGKEVHTLPANSALEDKNKYDVVKGSSKAEDKFDYSQRSMERKFQRCFSLLKMTSGGNSRNFSLEVTCCLLFVCEPKRRFHTHES